MIRRLATPLLIGALLSGCASLQDPKPVEPKSDWVRGVKKMLTTGKEEIEIGMGIQVTEQRWTNMRSCIIEQANNYNTQHGGTVAKVKFEQDLGMISRHCSLKVQLYKESKCVNPQAFGSYLTKGMIAEAVNQVTASDEARAAAEARMTCMMGDFERDNDNWIQQMCVEHPQLVDYPDQQRQNELNNRVQATISQKQMQCHRAR